MANAELNPGDWRDIQVLRAQGVLAELHTVDLEDADRGLRAYAAVTGLPLHTVAHQVVGRELTIARELCVPAPAPRRPEQRPDRSPRVGGADGETPSTNRAVRFRDDVRTSGPSAGILGPTASTPAGSRYGHRHPPPDHGDSALANDADNALCALREATAALRQATARRSVRESGIDKVELIADLATNLQALAALVRTTGLEPVPTTAASHNLQAVVQGITATASMARGMASLDGHHPTSHVATGGRVGVAPDD